MRVSVIQIIVVRIREGVGVMSFALRHRGSEQQCDGSEEGQKPEDASKLGPRGFGVTRMPVTVPQRAWRLPIGSGEWSQLSADFPGALNAPSPPNLLPAPVCCM